VTEDSFSGMDIVLGAATSGVAETYAPAIKAAGAVFVDNSSAFRMRGDVPLIIPEINGDEIDRHNGIISNPNCSTIIALTVLGQLHKYSPIKSVYASTYQAVSGVGAGGTAELDRQIKDYAAGDDPKAGLFDHVILNNVIPKIGKMQSDGYTDEETKLCNESRKILDTPDLQVFCTCVRVPVERSHCISLVVEQESDVSVDIARRLLQFAPGVVLADVERHLMPLYASKEDNVYVGRIRKAGRGLAMWICGDQIRKGAALNAVQIAEKIAVIRHGRSARTFLGD
ncbi:MAG: aspartate-semialdehyde dehydrogenase, partial [Defluviitaleaceae bacterium]|nr:aspartate-semialdehyde dehydrogenase [Defluviitaleaceae bacterium]